MSTSPIPFLQHILIETHYLIGQSETLSEEEFLNNETLMRAFVRSLGIIGEAVRNVSPELRQEFSHVEWRAMTGMRDRLIHGYFGIDYEIVWDAVINKVPELQTQIIQIIEKLESE